MTSKFGKELFREAGSSRWVQRLFKSLHQGGLITREEVARGSFRYSVCSEGVQPAGPQGPGEQFQAAGGVRPLPVGTRLQDHEDGVMELMGEFAAAGLVGAAGWRCWEHMGGSGGIAPDGLVYVEHSPYGPGGITLSTNGRPGVGAGWRGRCGVTPRPRE